MADRRVRWSALWLALVVLVASCGGDGDESSTTAVSATDGAVSTTSSAPATSTPDSTTAAGGDVDACVIVDADDAASVLGAPATAETSPGGGFGAVSSCVWATPSEALLVVSVFDGREFYGGGDAFGGEPLQIGDEGFIVVEPTSGGVDLQVLKGDWVMSLGAAPFGVVDVDGLPATMTDVAARAADRLP